MYALTRKRSELRETKLQNGNILGKSEQQEARIRDIKITMDHAVAKEELARENQKKYVEEIWRCKDSIRQLAIQIRNTKEKIANKGQELS